MERFTLQPFKHRPEYWICTDHIYGIVCTFEHYKFQQTQKYTFIGDIHHFELSLLTEVGIEMGNWLIENHFDKLQQHNLLQ